jgi:hypothetical protein
MVYVIIQISIFVTLLPIIFGISRYSFLSKEQRLLFWMVVLVSANQFTSQFLENHLLNLTNNLPFYRLYILVEFIFLTFIFRRLIDPENRIFWIIILSFSTYWTCDSFFLGTIWEYPEILRFTEGVLITSFCAIYFYVIFKNASVILILREFGFWLSAGLILYFASNSLLFLFSEVVLTLSNPSYYLIWTVHAFLTILLYIAYTIAIQCKTNHNLS